MSISTKSPDPVLTIDLFPDLQAGLVELLSGLDESQWQQPIPLSTWTVKDVALHLLGGEIGNISRRRDDFRAPAKPINSWAETVDFINDFNEQWIVAARRISPRVLCDLLAFTAPQLYTYFKSLDPFALGAPVGWAGSEPAPIWLDIAREYTERWYHQQQIREVVGEPGFKQPQYFAPVLATFIHALPQTFRLMEAAKGTIVVLTLVGDAGGRWCVIKEDSRWMFYQAVGVSPDAAVTLDQDIAWRLFTKGISPDEAFAHAALSGDQNLCLKIFDMVSIIA